MIDLRISVIDSMEGWQELAEDWPALLASSSSGSFFLTWEWLSAWLECCLSKNRCLFVLAIHEKEYLVGVAPFYIDRKKHGPFTLREVRFIGSPDFGSDYLDVVSVRGREREVANSLYDFLMGEGKKEWDLLRLQDIPSDALFLLHFMNRIQADGKYAEIAQGSYCPVVKLPGSEAEFLARLSQWRRKKFRQDMRIIYREQEVIHSVIQGNEVALKLGEFFHLYEEKGGWPGGRLRAFLQKFLEGCHGEKPVQIDLLSVNGKAVVGLLHLKYHDTLSMYLMAVDKNFNPKISLGNLLVGLSIKNSIAAGHAAYDFLKGDESYKFHWATGGKTSVQFFFWQKRPAALVSALTRLLRQTGKLMFR